MCGITYDRRSRSIQKLGLSYQFSYTTVPVKLENTKNTFLHDIFTQIHIFLPIGQNFVYVYTHYV